MSVYDDFQAAGIYVQTNSQDGANEFVHRRAETKKLLMSGLEVDDTHNQLWKLSMEQAHYPQRQETSQATTPVIKPVHDWTSHLRTMTEFYAVNKPKTDDDDKLTTPEPEEPDDDIHE